MISRDKDGYLGCCYFIDYVDCQDKRCFILGNMNVVMDGIIVDSCHKLLC